MNFQTTDNKSRFSICGLLIFISLFGLLAFNSLAQTRQTCVLKTIEAERVEPALSIPTLKLRLSPADSFYSENNHFVIHYTTEGKDAVCSEDLDNNSVPDWIEKMARAFENSYDIEINTLNYNHPPSMENGTVPYQIFVIDLGNSYGRTITINVDPGIWEQKNVSSYIVFDNDFVGPGFHIQGDDAIYVTAAHEFFHAIQLGYVFRKKDSFLFELSAVWMEDKVYDEINNYLYYLDYFFSAPEIPLNGVSFTIPNVQKHIYGDCILGFYIEENFGTDAIRKIWNLMPDKTALEAMDQFFRNRGSTFEEEFVKFAKWNFFTGERALPDFAYNEGTIFPEIATEKDTIIEYYHDVANAGYFLTAAYYNYRPINDGIYRISFSAEFPNHWQLGVIVWDDSILRDYTLNSGDSKNLDKVLSGQQIAVIPININRLANPEKIYFKEDPEEYSFVLRKERSSANTIKSFEISKSYPNPFSGAIGFWIKKISEQNINLKVINIRGQEIDRVFIGKLPNESNFFHWENVSLKSVMSPGIYFFRFSDENFSETIKIVYIH